MIEIPRHPRLTGALLFIASAQFVLSMVVEELLLPHYDPASQAISDLGNTAMYTPYSLMFNSSILVIGILTVVTALLLRQFLPLIGHARLGLVFLTIAGLGAIGVGLFPENVNGLAHGLSAFGAFGGGGLALICLAKAARRLLGKEWIYPFMVLGGIVDLAAFVAFVAGVGGRPYYGAVERVIVVPVLLWGLVFGGWLLLRGPGARTQANVERPSTSP